MANPYLTIASPAEIDECLKDSRNWLDRDLEPDEVLEMLLDLADAVIFNVKSGNLGGNPERVKSFQKLVEDIGDANFATHNADFQGQDLKAKPVERRINRERIQAVVTKLAAVRAAMKAFVQAVAS